jgi:hypothetical protein
MKRKNSSFYTKCQSNITQKKAFLRNVTRSRKYYNKLRIINDFY